MHLHQTPNCSISFFRFELDVVKTQMVVTGLQLSLLLARLSMLCHPSELTIRKLLRLSSRGAIKIYVDTRFLLELIYECSRHRSQKLAQAASLAHLRQNGPQVKPMAWVLLPAGKPVKIGIMPWKMTKTRGIAHSDVAQSWTRQPVTMSWLLEFGSQGLFAPMWWQTPKKNDNVDFCVMPEAEARTLWHMSSKATLKGPMLSWRCQTSSPVDNVPAGNRVNAGKDTKIHKAEIILSTRNAQIKA